jgi:hypothetical protein
VKLGDPSPAMINCDGSDAAPKLRRIMRAPESDYPALDEDDVPVPPDLNAIYEASEADIRAGYVTDVRDLLEAAKRELEPKPKHRNLGL